MQTVRVVAHTIGPVAPGAQLSQNHWSIYLLNLDGGSMRLNMEGVLGLRNDQGRFTVTRHAYARTNSAVRVFDFEPKASKTVAAFLQVIKAKGRQSRIWEWRGLRCAQYRTTWERARRAEWTMIIGHDPRWQHGTDYE